MGNRANGGARRRAGRRFGPAVAALAGATVVAAAVAGRRRQQRRDTPVVPEDAVAGPASDYLTGPPDAGGIATSSQAHAPTPPAGASTNGRTPAGARPTVDAPADVPTPVAFPAPADIPATRVATPTEPAPSTTAAAPAPAHPAPSGGEPTPGPRPRRDLGTTRPAPEPVDGEPGPEPHIPGHHPARRHDRRRRVVVAAVAAGVLVLGAGAVVAASQGDDDPVPSADVPAGDTPATSSSVATTLPPVTAAEAFGLAGQRLTEAGSFTYVGSVSATDVSHVRPMFWLAVESNVEGQVATSTGRLHEIAVAPDGTAAETVADGPDVWGRRAPAVDALVDQPYESIPGLSGDGAPTKGAALLPMWLTSATGSTEVGPDEQGRRTFQATIPASVFGAIERERLPVDATVVLTLDQAGAPARVQITSAPDGPPLRLTYDISALGDPVAIEPPA